MEIQQLYEIFKQCKAVTTDSRKIVNGAIFFALKGGNFNGNKYASSALEQGCAYAVVDEKEYALTDRHILVDDVLKTLQTLAAYHRKQLKTTIIGITGTNGKTTTKELVSSVLTKKYRTKYTQGNLNNHIGVPLTLLSIEPDDEMAVVEMGANHPGEIEFLVNIVCPDYGLITNVGRAHLEGFGSFEGVMKTKGELYDYLAGHGKKAFIDASNPYLCQMAQDRALETINYGTEQCTTDCLVKGSVKSLNPYMLAEINGKELQTRLIGDYNLPNVLAAACVGKYFGIDDEAINEAIAQYNPSNKRSEWHQIADTAFVIDAYNANPTSMAAAINNFAKIDREGKCVVIADMGELGEQSAEEHQKIADLLKDKGFEDVYLIGSNFMKTLDNFVHFDSSAQFMDYMGKNNNARQRFKGKTLLIKGSNSMKMADVARFIMEKTAE